MSEIDFIIGMPPDLPIDDGIQGRTNTVMRNSMPLAKIYPGVPSFQKGLDLFQRRPTFSGGAEKNYSAYHPLLQSHGFTLSGNIHSNHIKVAYLADSFPTDSFSNEYGENFLQKFTDVASEGAASIAQMFGARTATEGISQTINALKATGETGQMIGGAAQGIGKGLETFFNNLPLGKSGFGGAQLIDTLLAGSRVDFPMVWKTSGFQPSYTMTIRLYNPNPKSTESTKKYIVGPIAALMLLGIPQTVDGSTYSWPFIHRIHSPGIFDLDPAFISNITVIKGGDQQQIAYSQHLSIVDVRIDFGSLFSTILAGRKKSSKSRPTLEKYINGMLDEKGGIMNYSTRYGSGTAQADEAVNPVLTQTTRDSAPTKTETTEADRENVGARTSSTSQQISSTLKIKAPF